VLFCLLGRQQTARRSFFVDLFRQLKSNGLHNGLGREIYVYYRIMHCNCRFLSLFLCQDYIIILEGGESSSDQNQPGQPSSKHFIGHGGIGQSSFFSQQIVFLVVQSNSPNQHRLRLRAHFVLILTNCIVAWLDPVKVCSSPSATHLLHD
jgi:hypothetical protein